MRGIDKYSSGPSLQAILVRSHTAGRKGGVSLQSPNRHTGWPPGDRGGYELITGLILALSQDSVVFFPLHRPSFTPCHGVPSVTTSTEDDLCLSLNYIYIFLLGGFCSSLLGLTHPWCSVIPLLPPGFSLCIFSLLVPLPLDRICINEIRFLREIICISSPISALDLTLLCQAKSWLLSQPVNCPWLRNRLLVQSAGIWIRFGVDICGAHSVYPSLPSGPQRFTSSPNADYGQGVSRVSSVQNLKSHRDLICSKAQILRI